MIEGYRNYRDICKTPWNLKIVGTGKLGSLVKDVPGIEHLGFIQPDDVPNIMQSARCFIIPSTWEPWGVVIHEAVASGLPIIASSACGATTMFVRDGVNGYVIPPNTKAITDAMLGISKSSDEVLYSMSKYSRMLAGLWSPKMLAQYFYAKVSEKINRR